MQYKNVFEDFFWETTGTSVSYQIQDEDGQPVFNGKAYGANDTIRINVAQKIRDWLFNEIGDFREADGEFFDHPDAIHAFSLIVDNEVVEQWMVIYSFQPWNGDTLFLTTAINTHASPLQKLFITNGAKIDVPTHRTQDITDGGGGDGPVPEPPGPGPEPPGPEPPGPGELYFNVPSALTIPYYGGLFDIIADTNYAIDTIVVNSGGLTYVGTANLDRFRFSTGRNETSANKQWTVTFYSGELILGTTLVTQVFYVDRSGEYLGATALEDNTKVAWSRGIGGGSWVEPDPCFYYKIGANGTWTKENAWGPWVYVFATLNAGETIYFKASGDLRGYRLGWAVGADVGEFSFHFNKDVRVHGNILSMHYGDNFANNTELRSRMSGLFLSRTFREEDFDFHYWQDIFSTFGPHIVDSSELVFPSGTYYAAERSQMVTLTSARGQLLSRFFKNQSNMMFTVETLPATNITKNADDLEAYSGMFQGCSSLITAPTLPTIVYDYDWESGMTTYSTTYVKTYQNMFKDCTNLNFIQCSVDPSVVVRDMTYPDYKYNFSSAFKEWTTNVPSSGLFKKATGALWLDGVSGIPTGWTVQEI